MRRVRERGRRGGGKGRGGCMLFECFIRWMWMWMWLWYNYVT
jgi:hypothetical protein